MDKVAHSSKWTLFLGLGTFPLVRKVFFLSDDLRGAWSAISLDKGLRLTRAADDVVVVLTGALIVGADLRNACDLADLPAISGWFDCLLIVSRGKGETRTRAAGFG